MPITGKRSSPVLRRDGGIWRGEFQAMASPCQLLAENISEAEARAVLNEVAAEAWRIEAKFSRYIRGNIVDRINTSDGHEVEVDDETTNLLEFADSLCRMSEGRFDITSGALRKVWSFDGSDRVPARADVEAALQLVGWHRIQWKKPLVRLLPGMEIDLGGIGKEYAVDRAAAIVREQTGSGCLVNFGGDLVVVGQSPKAGWRVGIDSIATEDSRPARLIHLHGGALATSGDSHRFLLKDGVRFGHVLNPMTGWPVEGAPRSISVAADTCTQAGMLATLAMLRGKNAEQFLEEQSIKFWCLR